jgi:D-tyrosyl-tRNA(Tyr) deacylase
MRAIIQRVSTAAVYINDSCINTIGKGYVILLGIARGDTEKELAQLVEKIVHLRIMSDEKGKMNKSLLDVDGEVLVVSQFTLLADIRKGRRPSFLPAAAPDVSQPLYEKSLELFRSVGVKRVASGKFGAMMTVMIHNDGPVTIIMDTNDSLQR